MSVEAQQLSRVLEQLTAEQKHSVFHYAESLLQQSQERIEARTAQRKVGAWLVSEVGNLLMGGAPEFVPGARPVWRVPVLVTKERRGQATFVDVDAQTGQLLIDDQTPSRIMRDVHAFVAHSPHP